MNIVMTLSHHNRHPEISYGQYLGARTLALGERMNSVIKIYLDTKFWLLFRDVRLGRNNDSQLKSLLHLLEGLVAAKHAVCPMSTVIFHEIFRQSDISTLATSVELIDQLSHGICCIEHLERVNIEARHFLTQITKGSNAVHPLERLVWTKAAFVLGHCSPRLDGVDDATNAAIQKAFLDQLWSLKLSDLMEQMGDKAASWSRAMPDISQPLNEGKFANMDDYVSFNELFLIELRGILDACKPGFAEMANHLYARETKNTSDLHLPLHAGSGIAIANIIYESFRQGKISRELPTLRVAATLHAGVRWDHKRKFKRNDCSDFRHACAAIPYCDFFFTERSLCHLVSDKVMGLRDHFGCKVFSDAESALRELALLV